MPVRTLLLSEIFPPRTGGSGRWLWEIYRRLSRQQLLICAGTHPRQAEFDARHDVPLLRIPLTLPSWGLRSAGALRDYGRLFNLVRRLKKQHAVTEVHCARMLPEGWVGWMARRALGLSYLVYVHGEETNYGMQSRELGWMMRRVLASARLVVANSHNTAAILREQWSVPAEQIEVLHPGVDVQEFTPTTDSGALRRKLGWQGRRVLLTVGRLQARKGHDHLIRALPAIREQIPEVHYAIAGEGEERPRLESLVNRLDLQRHVQWLGELTDQELVESYQACDLFVLPNREIDGDIEGFGMVLLEAQSCGKPVIAGDSGGTAETMHIPHTGKVIDCTNPDTIAAETASWLRDEPLLIEKGRAARSWVTDRFAWPTLSRRAAKILGLDLEEDRIAPIDTGVSQAAG